MEIEKEDNEVKRVAAPGITWYTTLFGLLKNNLLDVKGADIEDLQDEAKKWWNSAEVIKTWWGKTLHNVLDHWGAKTLMLIGRVFADRWFYDWINNVDEVEEEEEEDERL